MPHTPAITVAVVCGHFLSTQPCGTLFTEMPKTSHIYLSAEQRRGGTITPTENTLNKGGKNEGSWRTALLVQLRTTLTTRHPSYMYPSPPRHRGIDG